MVEFAGYKALDALLLSVHHCCLLRKPISVASSRHVLCMAKVVGYLDVDKREDEWRAKSMHSSKDFANCFNLRRRKRRWVRGYCWRARMAFSDNMLDTQSSKERQIDEKSRAQEAKC